MVFVDSFYDSLYKSLFSLLVFPLYREIGKIRSDSTDTAFPSLNIDVTQWKPVVFVDSFYDSLYKSLFSLLVFPLYREIGKKLLL